MASASSELKSVPDIKRPVFSILGQRVSFSDPTWSLANFYAEIFRLRSVSATVSDVEDFYREAAHDLSPDELKTLSWNTWQGWVHQPSQKPEWSCSGPLE